MVLVTTDPAPLAGSGPICPRCGGGPQVPTPLGMVCRSCAAVLGPVPQPSLTDEDDDGNPDLIAAMRDAERAAMREPVTKPPADEPDTPHRE